MEAEDLRGVFTVVLLNGEAVKVSLTRDDFVGSMLHEASMAFGKKLLVLVGPDGEQLDICSTIEEAGCCVEDHITALVAEPTLPVIMCRGHQQLGQGLNGRIVRRVSGILDSFGCAASIAFTARVDRLGEPQAFEEFAPILRMTYTGAHSGTFLSIHNSELAEENGLVLEVSRRWESMSVIAPGALGPGGTRRYLCTVSIQGYLRIFVDGEELACGRGFPLDPGRYEWFVSRFDGDFHDLMCWDEEKDWSEAEREYEERRADDTCWS